MLFVRWDILLQDREGGVGVVFRGQRLSFPDLDSPIDSASDDGLLIGRDIDSEHDAFMAMQDL